MKPPITQLLPLAALGLSTQEDAEKLAGRFARDLLASIAQPKGSRIQAAIPNAIGLGLLAFLAGSLPAEPKQLAAAPIENSRSDPAAKTPAEKRKRKPIEEDIVDADYVILPTKKKKR